MRKRILIASLAASLPPMVLAQIFGPTIVYDPTQSAHVVTEIARIVQLYKTATQTYNQIAYNAAWFTNKSRWLGIATQVVNSNTRSIFGETGGWNPAVTTGINIPGAGLRRLTAFIHRGSTPVFRWGRVRSRQTLPRST